MRAAEDAAFTAFVAAWSDRLLRSAYLLTGDRQSAEDLLQGALERTYRRWPLLLRDGEPTAYVRRALVNAATDRWRRRRGVVETAWDGVDLPTPDPQPDLDARDALLRVVRRLPAGQRAVLVLRYFDDLSEADTAAVMGCSVGTVKSQHARALARLRELLPTGGP